jgi:hypothetical protein
MGMGMGMGMGMEMGMIMGMGGGCRRCSMKYFLIYNLAF